MSHILVCVDFVWPCSVSCIANLYSGICLVLCIVVGVLNNTSAGR